MTGGSYFIRSMIYHAGQVYPCNPRVTPDNYSVYQESQQGAVFISSHPTHWEALAEIGRLTEGVGQGKTPIAATTETAAIADATGVPE